MYNCTYEGFFSVHYGGATCATVSGNVTYDRVNISNANIPEMGVETAYVAGCFTDSMADGILGLGFGVNNRGIFPMQWLRRIAFADSIRSFSQATYIHGTPHTYIA